MQPARIFLSIELIELSVFNPVCLLVLWLQRAVEGTHIRHGGSWEVTLRRDLSDMVAVNADACRVAVDRSGGHRLLKAELFQFGNDEASLGSSEVRASLDSSNEQVSAKRDDKQLFV